YSPQDREELFNLRHAQARNVIERIFGVLKHRFRILLIGPEYSPQIQSYIPTALAAIHNFIRIYDPQEGRLPGGGNQFDLGVNAGDFYVRDIATVSLTAAAQKRELDNRRDRIAQDMWDDYQLILKARRGNTDHYLYNIENETEPLVGSNTWTGDERIGDIIEVSEIMDID
ncbi:hypothetical protein AN958_07065, partial [Leucoagaricus sp. SymC.cos]